MPSDRWRMDLKGDLRKALEGQGLQRLEVLEAALLSVLPHLEAAYERGVAAGRSSAGYRLVAENERLRRQIPNQRKESE